MILQRFATQICLTGKAIKIVTQALSNPIQISLILSLSLSLVHAYEIMQHFI